MICNVCDKCIHSAVCDRKAVLERIPYMTHCTYKHTEADIINPELEKIKAEILDKVSMYENDFLIEPHFVEEVINKRISELKGEQK